MIHTHPTASSGGFEGPIGDRPEYPRIARPQLAVFLLFAAVSPEIHLNVSVEDSGRGNDWQTPKNGQIIESPWALTSLTITLGHHGEFVTLE